ncbi:MAG: hypothetical protein WCB96_08230, partial [Candidatus Aminicenantales bacterium]
LMYKEKFLKVSPWYSLRAIMPETPTNSYSHIYPPGPLGQTRGRKDGVSGKAGPSAVPRLPMSYGSEDAPEEEKTP